MAIKNTENLVCTQPVMHNLHPNEKMLSLGELDNNKNKKNTRSIFLIEGENA